MKFFLKQKLETQKTMFKYTWASQILYQKQMLNALCYNHFENKGHLRRIPYTFISNQISDLIKNDQLSAKLQCITKKAQLSNQEEFSKTLTSLKSIFQVLFHSIKYCPMVPLIRLLFNSLFNAFGPFFYGDDFIERHYRIDSDLKVMVNSRFMLIYIFLYLLNILKYINANYYYKLRKSAVNNYKQQIYSAESKVQNSVTLDIENKLKIICYQNLLHGKLFLDVHVSQRIFNIRKVLILEAEAEKMILKRSSIIINQMIIKLYKQMPTKSIFNWHQKILQKVMINGLTYQINKAWLSFKNIIFCLICINFMKNFKCIDN